MGFIHYNNTHQEQLDNVLKVKRHVPGYVVTPAVLPPTATVEDVLHLRVRARLRSLANDDFFALLVVERALFAVMRLR